MQWNKSPDPSQLAMLQLAATKFEEINKKVVYVGGCTTALFLTDPLSSKVRTTLDVDCVIDVLASEYRQLEKVLRQKGFRESSQDNIICRWRYDDLIIDIMPADETVLGFTNCWFKETIKHAETYILSENISIQVASPPYFIGTKMAAFKTRGNNDFLGSHDLEDIMTVIAGRPEITTEILFSDAHIKCYIQDALTEWINNNQFLVTLPGHMNDSILANEKAALVLKCLKQIVRDIA